ncbi:hypothetical protein, partial [Niallia circulans]|uniref:hypothetical protein n=1 Tax=Niallia circulans TaxID=1397 RepID=UPI00155FA329
ENNMKKVILSILSILFIFSTTNLTTYAETSNKNVSEQENEKINSVALSDITDRYENLEVIDPSTLPKDSYYIEVDNLDELDQLFSTIQGSFNELDKNEVTYDNSTDLTIPNTQPIMLAAASTKNGSARIGFVPWTINPVHLVLLPLDMWIDFTYTYTGSGSKRKFSEIKKIKSNSNGIPSSWHQTTGISNFYDSKKGVEIKIQGYHLLGVKVGGQDVGYKFSGTYTKKWHF